MVKIISDSTCDLSPELLERYDIDLLPLHIILGEQDYEELREQINSVLSDLDTHFYKR